MDAVALVDVDVAVGGIDGNFTGMTGVEQRAVDVRRRAGGEVGGVVGEDAFAVVGVAGVDLAVIGRDAAGFDGGFDATRVVGLLDGGARGAVAPDAGGFEVGDVDVPVGLVHRHAAGEGEAAVGGARAGQGGERRAAVGVDAHGAVAVGEVDVAVGGASGAVDRDLGEVMVVGIEGQAGDLIGAGPRSGGEVFRVARGVEAVQRVVGVVDDVDVAGGLVDGELARALAREGAEGGLGQAGAGGG